MVVAVTGGVAGLDCGCRMLAACYCVAAIAAAYVAARCRITSMWSVSPAATALLPF